jgi:DNA-binding NarL/FixJ family response regulator
MPQRIFIVEDHDWAREALASLLRLEPDLEVCGTASSAEDALESLPSGCDLVLVDIGMRGMSGLELIRTIRERWPDLRCVVLSGQPSAQYAAAAHEAGAAAYVEKGDAPTLLATIKGKLDGDG